MEADHHLRHSECLGTHVSLFGCSLAFVPMVGCTRGLCCYILDDMGTHAETLIPMPNQSPEPTRMGAFILRLSVLICPATVPAWLSFRR